MKSEQTTSKQRISDLERQIEEANKQYRTGEAIMSDSDYDLLIEELEQLDPNNSLLDKIGFLPADKSRMQDLPVPMASMNKIKTIEDYQKWLKNKDIKPHTLMVLTPKYDGAVLVGLGDLKSITYIFLFICLIGY